jgi:NADH dehydrogenase [ubiquinone] 1 alpha subcomplex assembly factor 7
MFGESLGIWMIAAMQNNLAGVHHPFQIVEMGPGSGLMMADMLRTVSQFTGNLKNINVALVESSENLAKQQQDRLIELLQKKLGIFLSYDLESKKQGR